VTFSYELAIIVLCGMVMAARKNRVRSLHDRLKLIHEVEKNPGEKRVDIAKRLGLPASTLNSIFTKKNDIREQVQICGAACKKQKNYKQSTFVELETVLFTWYQQARASNIPIDGTILKEKVKIIAAKLNIDCFSASSGCLSRFKHRHGPVFKKLAGESGVSTVEELCEAYGSTRCVKEKNKDENEEVWCQASPRLTKL
jgi:hypothetical protein